MIPEILKVYDMAENRSLFRFLDAQQEMYDVALAEIRSGKKRSHWMWYIFPQIIGLGFTDISKYYAIHDLEEAKQYLAHPILGSRLIEIAKAVLNQAEEDAAHIFGTPDDLKLRSSMTLFSAVPKADPVFQKVLDEFFNGKADEKTQFILSEASKNSEP